MRALGCDGAFREFTTRRAVSSSSRRRSGNQSVCWSRAGNSTCPGCARTIRRLTNVPQACYSSPAQWRLVGIVENNQFRMQLERLIIPFCFLAPAPTTRSLMTTFVSHCRVGHPRFASRDRSIASTSTWSRRGDRLLSGEIRILPRGGARSPIRASTQIAELLKSTSGSPSENVFSRACGLNEKNTPSLPPKRKKNIAENARTILARYDVPPQYERKLWTFLALRLLKLACIAMPLL